MEIVGASDSPGRVIAALAVAGSLLLAACSRTIPGPSAEQAIQPYAVVLGIAQDAGYPQAGCKKACCKDAWINPALRRRVASLAIVDPESGERWIVDATPDFKDQLRALDALQPVNGTPGLAGILLTHGHIGHYTGLMQLGREVIGASSVPVYAMPRMQDFLSKNGPWDLLVRLKNVSLVPLRDGEPVKLNARITVTPFLVPHRDEYTETVGFRIQGPKRAVVYMPDIDKWEKWSVRIEDAISGSDVAYVDGTFYEGDEVGRDISEIPHPFISESLARFASLPAAERAKVRFIHLNHTNPALIVNSPARKRIEEAGFRVAEEMERVAL
ncbi:MAG TPA: MBL fold metallo-hydrolase [Blastocatellia bacterium]|nr:MBL fold metallo-hydrolase [Blastocatellia bacterium]